MEASQTKALVGEVVDAEPGADTASELEEAPRKGTLAWLELQEHVDVAGRELPSVHRIPDGATWRSDADRGSRCALIRSDGSACGAVATRRYGVCLAHCGGAMQDFNKGSALGTAKLARLRVQRELLGIGPSRVANPRALARLAASERAAEIAEALLAPLDDRKLGSLEKQGAARVILGETFPQSTASIELELPVESGAVAAMGWADMQALAARLLEPDLDLT